MFETVFIISFFLKPMVLVLLKSKSSLHGLMSSAFPVIVISGCESTVLGPCCVGLYEKFPSYLFPGSFLMLNTLFL